MIRPRSRCETSAPRSYRLASPRSAGLGPPSRRRPLSSTGTGGVEARRDALTALRLAPARLTQSTTPSKSKTESGEYFTSSSGASCARPSSPLISSSSFASSPCCPPSLSEWRCRSVPAGSRTLQSDYYSAQKKPAFSHDRHACPLLDTIFCACICVGGMHDRKQAHVCRSQRCNFSQSSEMPMLKGFPRHSIPCCGWRIVGKMRTARKHFGHFADASSMPIALCTKFLVKSLAH